MQQTTHNLGHAKHRQAFGHNPRSSRQKLIMQLDARKREAAKVKQPREPMKASIAELMGRR